MRGSTGPGDEVLGVAHMGRREGAKERGEVFGQEACKVIGNRTTTGYDRTDRKQGGFVSFDKKIGMG